MKITLPPRSSGEAITLDSPKRITIIGANGAGKTRFARAMKAAMPSKAYSMSALKALYGRDNEDRSPLSADSLYHAAAESSPLIRADIKGELDRLISLLINETVVDMLRTRYTPATEAEPDKPRATRLDRVIELWQKVFPDNKILIECGRMLVESNTYEDTYATSLLSAGERAVMYYIAAAMYAPRHGVVFVDSPEMFLHQSSIRSLWDCIEDIRPDCLFVYITHDLGFAASRADGATIWVKNCDSENHTWDYDRLPPANGLPEEMYLAILGERKPVLFIEGDGVNSYDARLYPLIFKEYTVKSLGGCDRVIEATRSFNGLSDFHNLDAFGIVDRDRRDPGEVRYLRGRKILVPEVAEIENIFLIEDVVKTVARANGRNPETAFSKVKRNLMRLFESEVKRQALLHTRHRVKKTVAHRVDGKFDNISALENHLHELLVELNPKGLYDSLLSEFRSYLATGDYQSVLRVFNFKSMLSETHVAAHAGIRSDDKEAYIDTILDLLHGNTDAGNAIRAAIRATFDLNE